MSSPEFEKLINDLVTEGEPLELLRSADVNFQNSARFMAPVIRENPIFLLANAQLRAAIQILEAKS